MENTNIENPPQGFISKVKYCVKQFFQRFTPTKTEFKEQPLDAALKTLILIGGIVGTGYVLYIAAIIAFFVLCIVAALFVLGLLLVGLGGGTSSDEKFQKEQDEYYQAHEK